jgi:hypothetical protein
LESLAELAFGGKATVNIGEDLRMRSTAASVAAAVITSCSVSCRGGPDHGGADELVEAVAPEESCEVPAELAGELIEQPHPRMDIREASGLTKSVHVQRAVLDDEGVLWAVGSGGLFVVDVGGEAPKFLGTLDAPGSYLFEDVVLFPDAEWVVTVNSAQDMVMIIDARDPTRPTRISDIEVDGCLSVAQTGEYLYVGTRQGTLLTFSLRNPTEPRLLSRLEDVGHAWELRIEGDVLYAASDQLGVVAVDLSRAEAPVRAGVTPTQGAALSLTVGGSPPYLYVAEASAGLEVFSLAEPLKPRRVHGLDLGQSLVSARANGDLLWMADLEGVALLDIEDPAQPAVIAWEATPEWALGAVPLPGLNEAVVLDWSGLQLLRYTGGTPAPSLALSPTTIYLNPLGGTASLRLENMGNAPLQISGLGSSDHRVVVDAQGPLSLAAGEEMQLEITSQPIDEDLSASLCLATDDPDQSLVELPLRIGSQGSTGLALGQPAPEFSLTGLDGREYSLADQAGRPVFLLFFATW